MEPDKPHKKCHICNMGFLYEYVDGKTVHGPWAAMCLPCHKVYGVGLGTGKGQHYKYLRKGAYIKIAG